MLLLLVASGVFGLLATLSSEDIIPKHLHFATKPLALIFLWLFARQRTTTTTSKNFKKDDGDNNVQSDGVQVRDKTSSLGSKSQPQSQLLLLALFFSLGGDVLLMFGDDYFIPGLASFLFAHVWFILLFKNNVPFLPSKLAASVIFLIAFAVYSQLLPSLQRSKDTALLVAVGVYCSVISLMASQAIGRSIVLPNVANTVVALATIVFMISDALIAINRFLVPVPHAELWILSTYYVAQLLITFFADLK